MGTTRKIRRKYTGPNHPWRADRLAAEAILKTEYGLKNKTEIFRAQSALRRFTGQAKRLIRSTAAQAQVEEKQLLTRLFRLGLLPQEAKLDEVLALNVRNLLDRRLQTLVYKQNFSLTPKQARQMITHGHITVKGKKLDSPSFVVPREWETSIAFNPISTIASEEHPERAKEKSRREKHAAAVEKKVSEDAQELKKLEEIEKTVGAEVVQ